MSAPGEVLVEIGTMELLAEHSLKPVVTQALVLNRWTWCHAFGKMLIEACADGSVWIDGKPVPETLPRGDAQAADPVKRSGAAT